MTDEEINRKFEVVANHLAALAVGMQQLQEAQARTDATVAQLTARVAEVTEQVAQIATQQTHMNEVVAVIADAQQHTDERLNALIGMFERHITETHGGQG
jgi:septal ring factor EnvC (AmiA/AmiB activator)